MDHTQRGHFPPRRMRALSWRSPGLAGLGFIASLGAAPAHTITSSALASSSGSRPKAEERRSAGSALSSPNSLAPLQPPARFCQSVISLRLHHPGAAGAAGELRPLQNSSMRPWSRTRARGRPSWHLLVACLLAAACAGAWVVGRGGGTTPTTYSHSHEWLNAFGSRPSRAPSHLLGAAGAADGVRQAPSSPWLRPPLPPAVPPHTVPLHHSRPHTHTLFIHSSLTPTFLLPSHTPTARGAEQQSRPKSYLEAGAAGRAAVVAGAAPGTRGRQLPGACMLPAGGPATGRGRSREPAAKA